MWVYILCISQSTNSVCYRIAGNFRFFSVLIRFAKVYLQNRCYQSTNTNYQCENSEIYTVNVCLSAKSRNILL